MGRPSKPWFRKVSDSWQVKILGKQYTLAKGIGNKKLALQRFHELKSSSGDGPNTTSEMSVEHLFNLFLTKAETSVGPERLESLRYYLGRWLRYVGPARSISSIKAQDASGFLHSSDHIKWAKSTVQTVLTILKQPFTWAVEQEFLATSPLKHLRGPGFQARETVLSGDQVEKILGCAQGWRIRDLVEFAWATGCRPSEAMRLEAEHVDLTNRSITMKGKTTRKTGKLRTIYFTDQAAEILRRRMEWYPHGALFRTRDSLPWTKSSLSKQFRKIRRALGMGPECTAEGLRHGFATDAAFEVKPLVLAGLLGHTSTSMVERFYVDVAKRSAEMLAELDKVR